MRARDDYPNAAGATLAAYNQQHAAMCEEIDHLRHECDENGSLVGRLTARVEQLLDISARDDRLWSAALEAMNQAVLMAAREGSPKGMEFIAEWLDSRDSIDDEVYDEVDRILGGREFPADLVASDIVGAWCVAHRGYERRDFPGRCPLGHMLSECDLRPLTFATSVVPS